MAKMVGTSVTQHLTSMGREERSAALGGGRRRQESRINRRHGGGTVAATPLSAPFFSCA